MDRGREARDQGQGVHFDADGASLLVADRISVARMVSAISHVPTDFTVEQQSFLPLPPSIGLRNRQATSRRPCQATPMEAIIRNGAKVIMKSAGSDRRKSWEVRGDFKAPDRGHRDRFSRIRHDRPQVQGSPDGRYRESQVLLRHELHAVRGQLRDGSEEQPHDPVGPKHGAEVLMEAEVRLCWLCRSRHNPRIRVIVCKWNW